MDDTKAKYLNVKDSTSSTFEFHKVLSESSRQEEAFEAVEDMVGLALGGYDTTVMAYGQTGSGKTHTLLGDVHEAAQQGIIPRAMRRLLESIEKDVAISSEVTVSMVEIYRERIRDLLNPTGNALTLRDGTGASQLPEATLVRVRSEAQCMELLARGLLHRSVAATGQHEASSRSHCLVSVHVSREWEEAGDGKERGDARPAPFRPCRSAGSSLSPSAPTRETPPSSFPPATRRLRRCSCLRLVDLAGSERASRTQAGGQTLAEGAQINLSLGALSAVVVALAGGGAGAPAPGRHVPFRDSKLTRLLQSSLAGRGSTVLVLCASSEMRDAGETLGTLRFGARAQGLPVVLEGNAAKEERALPSPKGDGASSAAEEETSEGGRKERASRAPAKASRLAGPLLGGAVAGTPQLRTPQPCTPDPAQGLRESRTQGCEGLDLAQTLLVAGKLEGTAAAPASNPCRRCAGRTRLLRLALGCLLAGIGPLLLDALWR